ncbi:Dna2 domain-containing protein [Meloidogyne graminicola]|uniref:Dna2 domain-containing protein n=1 Tax=Meloidogyne graminicola TaxID=189291 RepID=A0A8S9ZYW9_9BILA|nr:Dna2 domain-containing protein [Meloidogyne graminicola]
MLRRFYLPYKIKSLDFYKMSGIYANPILIDITQSPRKLTTSPPAAKKSRTYKRRIHHKLFNLNHYPSSGVKGFPSLVNKNKHLLASVINYNKGVDTHGIPYISLKCELADESITNPTISPSKMQKIDVFLRDSWFLETPELCLGQLIRLIKPKRIDEKTFEICDPPDDDQNFYGGLLIIEPETLISSTQLAQSHYCPRKAMFQDRFRTEETTVAMTVGTVAHELFQIALNLLPEDLSSAWLFDVYRKHFLSKFCPDLIGMGCSLEKFEEELRLYLENISNWIISHHPHYATVNIKKQKNLLPIAQLQKHDNDENIDPNIPSEPFFYLKTHDIEENIWTPTIGFKGRIDISFVTCHFLFIRIRNIIYNPGGINSDQSNYGKMNLISPLELKTGKSYGSVGSVEHQTQVMLYSLLLSERTNNGRLSSGFLLYLRDNKIASVQPKAVQLRGIIQFRNRLATHFSKFTIDSFPEPLRNPRICVHCPYATLCGTIALRNESTTKDENLKSHTNNLSNEMHTFMSKQTSHLSRKEVIQINEWIERGLQQWGKAWEHGSTLRLFRKNPQERFIVFVESLGTCLAYMQLNYSTDHKGDGDSLQQSFLLHFSRENIEKLKEFQLKVVILFADKKLPSNVSDHENTPIYYHLDKHDGFTSFAFALGNILKLLENTEKAKLLRSIFISDHLKTSEDK